MPILVQACIETDPSDPTLDLCDAALAEFEQDWGEQALETMNLGMLRGMMHEVRGELEQADAVLTRTAADNIKHLGRP